MTSPTNYISFILDDEEFVLLPGSRFSKLELKSRLKEMNIKDNNSQDKEYLKALYDLAIQDYKNRVKIINRLRKDTINLNSVLNLNRKQPMPSNINIPNYLTQNKMMNMSDDLNNKYPNIRQNQMNIRKPLNNNNYNYNQEILNNNNNYTNSEYDYNNYNKNINNNYNFNNNFNNNNFNNDYRNHKKQYEEINTDINDNNYNNEYGQYTYPEKINVEDNIKYNFKKKPNFQNNLHTIPESNYENDSEKYEKYENNNYINYMNQQKNHNIKIIPSKNVQKNNNKIPNNQMNNYYQENYHTNKDENKKGSFIDALYEEIEVKNNYKEKNKDKEEKDDDYDKEKDNKKKDKDDISTFSFFNVFEKFKKYPLYKHRKFILIHCIVLLLFLIISISFLKYIYDNHETIINIFSNFFQILLQPRRILDLITSFFSLLILGPIRNWHISIPLLVIGFVFYLFLRKYLFKKRCKEIIEKIVEHLEKGESKKISEEEIYKKIVQSYGISYSKYIKKYLPQMKKIRRNDNRLKLSSAQINEKAYIFWELSI